MVPHISDTQVTAESFAQGLGYGRTNFFKKVKQLTGMSPNDYIKKIRMEQYLVNNTFNRLKINELH